MQAMARSRRPKAEILLTDDERVELERLARWVRVNRHVAMRAKLLLESATGASDVARETEYDGRHQRRGTERPAISGNLRTTS